MTVLATLQTLMGKVGMPIPSAIIGATDAHTVQLKALTQEAIEFLGMRPWQMLEARVTGTTLTGSDQGTLDSLFAASLVADVFQLGKATLFHEETATPLVGPVSRAEWQALVTSAVGGPFYSYTILGDHLWVWPAMTAGDTLSAIVRTNWIVRSSSGVPKETITSDEDGFAIPEMVVLKEVEWRWLKQKGEPWTAAYEEAKALVSWNLAAKGAGATLQMDGGSNGGPRPGVWVPSGGWDLF